MTQVSAVSPNFHEWMSGRYWLGDKAPAEGFYGRYSDFQLELLEIGFYQGAAGVREYVYAPLDDNDRYLLEWSRWVGDFFYKKLNEKQG